ncbi:hypothetical protein TWF506_005474 [Arthrobotrys conoides]|uniref:Uncharacterized protein n=1 Tax=Arthrobotrys conoides TaxID=74498 RepID=A0AAN8NE92_9PEZI
MELPGAFTNNRKLHQPGLHCSINVHQPNNPGPAKKGSLLPNMPPKTPRKSPYRPTLQVIPETPIEKSDGISSKTIRFRYIKDEATKVLSKMLGKAVDSKQVSFTVNFKREYNWFIAVTTLLNEEAGSLFTTEYDLPDWTKEQMWRWKSHECQRMVDWLDRGFIKVEIVEGKTPRVRKIKLEDTAGTKKIELLHMEALFSKSFIKEVCIIVHTKGKKRYFPKPWTRPTASVKEPASNFVAWMTGSADNKVTQKMNKEYLNIKDNSEGRFHQGVRISYGGFGGDPVITEVPVDDDALSASDMTEDDSDGIVRWASYSDDA